MKNKKEIKVYMQFPWKISDSQYYKSLNEYPPEGISYINLRKNEGMVTNPKMFRLLVLIRKYAREIPERLHLKILNARFSKSPEHFDLIHCAHCLSKNKNVPWVADFEGTWQMLISGARTKKGISKARKLLHRENCKKIIAWTESSKKAILKYYPELENKIEIVSYAIPPIKFKNKNSKNITLFHSARYFYKKGGHHAVEVMDRLTKKYPHVRGVINGNIPKEVLDKYSQNKKLKFYPLMPYKDILKLYQEADIFVYPGYTDSFGFVFQDAMACGAPIITANGFARKDIIAEGKTGFVIEVPDNLDRISLENPKRQNLEPASQEESELIENLTKKTEELILNKKLWARMSRECIKEVTTGKFSIETRNKKLKKIYRDAIK